ncbi:MAG: Filamentous hemagglutinin family outer membrane protein, partial [Verrucomicrobiales bacterium]|nr:Filamentous hemagglutinin family outer membrane protein [Verrucomicrobiales bacterium]
MRYKTLKRICLSGSAFRLTAAFVAAACDLIARANPQGMSVVSGSAVARTTGPHLELNVSPVTILDWHSFNIGVGETTRFIQPSVDSIVFNRIGDVNPSQIFGNLSANGTVILANQNGFYFGPNSVISVGNLIATTSPSLPDFGSGGAWQFTGLPPLASIVNYGKIQTPSGGSVYLIAEQIANHGSITAPEGSIGLFAGKEVLVSERPDGRGLSAAVRLPAGSVNNDGKLIADAGAISMHAQVVNQNGLIQANTVRERNGTIELVASEALNLAPTSEVLAEGGLGAGPGGEVLLKSDGDFHDESGSKISVAGGARGGTGGSLELSAPRMTALNSQLDARAQAGFAFGNLLLDPTDIILDKTGTGSAPGGEVPVGTPGTTLRLNVNTAFRNFSTVTLQATRDITLAANTIWNLYDSTGKSEPGCLLTLQAGRNILFGNSSSIIDSTTDPADTHWQGLWSVKMQAGYDFSQKVVNAVAGGIYLSGGPANGSGVIPTGSGSIELYRGSISLEAAADLLVGSGFIRTVGGGDIFLKSVNGDVNAGTRNDNFQFSARGYEVSQKGLGGIATAHGGDIEIHAGGDIISDPKKPASEISPGASGTYGAEPGNVSLSAGGDILGNFLVRNGMGKIAADGDAGTVKKPLTLSLISGSWDVSAGNDIVVTEVRNPQGTFNSVKLPVPAGQWIGNIDDDAVPQRLGFLFDYALDSSVKFTAGNSVTLLGENLPRINKQNENMKPVYPPSLAISAGAGGIEIDSTITLFPAPQGSLSLVTHDGGDLRGQQIGNSLTGIIMSDSGLPSYSTFGSGHALVPVHLQDHHPVQVAINGGVQNFLLSVPKAAMIDVRQDAYNFGFLGQNLAGSDVTTISIGQNLSYRGFITEVPLGDVPNPAVLDPVQSTNPDLAQKLFYNAQTGKFGFRGQMSDQDLRFLLDPTVYALDSTGQVMLDYLGNPTPIPARFTADVAGLQSLFEQTQTASLGDQGLALGGPGTFRIVAKNIDLGISGGIQTLPANKALIPISPYGAALEVSVLEDLSMSST